MSNEIYCEECKDQKIYCPKCKTESIHSNVKALHGQKPSITKIELQHMEFHNFTCPNLDCMTFFSVSHVDLKQVRMITNDGEMSLEEYKNKKL
jgi:predicted nucleic-acid-binding Zn-ribbon protein